MPTSTRKPFSPNDLPEAAAPDWMRFVQDCDALEIHPCAIVGRDGVDGDIVEPCEPESADFWTVFGHLRTGGLETFQDFPTEEEATAFHDRLLAAYPHLAWSGT